MKTLDQYRAVDVGNGALDLFEAAQAFTASQVPAMPETPASRETPDGGMLDVTQDPTMQPLLDPDPHVSKVLAAGQPKLAAMLKGFQSQAEAPEPGFFTKALTLASGQTWETAKSNKAMAVTEAKQLIDEGKFDQAYQRLNYASEGITEVTSPVEFLAPGRALASLIGGKTALKVFSAGAPIEYAGTMMFEEVAEDNTLVGLAGMVASGVLAGNVGQRMVNAAEKITAKASAPEQLQEIAIALKPKSVVGTEAVTTYTRLGAKQAALDDADYLHKFTLGDITDYRVRGAYENLVAELNKQEITPETAGIVRAIELKLQGTGEPKLGDYTLEASTQVAPTPPKTILRKGSAAPKAEGTPESTQPQGDTTPVSSTVETPQDVVEAPIGPVEAQGKIPEAPTWDTLKPGDQVTLYRGESVDNDTNGQWWTTRRDKAEQFGAVKSAVVPSEFIGKHAVRGHGGAHEFVFPSEGARPADFKQEPVTLTPDMPLPVSKSVGPDYSPFGEPPALNADQIKALEQETIEEWFGKPKFNVPGVRKLKQGEKYTRAELDKIHGTVINQYAARMQKLDPALPPDEALRQAQTKFYDDLAKGIHGEDYKSDVDDLFQTLVSNAKKAKQKVNLDDLRAKAHELTYQEYVAEYEKALAKKKASVRAQGGIKKKYIEGYTGSVWEDQNMVELNIKVHPETGSLVYDSAISPPVAGSKTKEPFKSRNFDYGAIKSRADAEHAMKQFIHAGENARVWTTVGGNKKKVLPGSEKVRSKGWRYDIEAKKTVDTEGLSDNAYIQVAKMYGWDEMSIPPVQKFDASGKQISYTDTEDLIKGFNQYNEFEQSMPGWLRREADMQAEVAPDPRYYAATLGRAGYINGVKDFLRQKFNLPANAEPWKLTQRVEELAVMQTKLLEDISLATGTPQEAFAKRMYLLFKDKITGSHSLEYAKTVNQARQRELGYYEVLDFQGKRTKNPALQLEADQGKYGMTGTDTPDSQLADDLDNFDADNPEYDGSSIRPANDADAYEEGLSIKSKGPGVDPYAQYAEERKLYYAKQVNEIENKFGVRYSDEPYGSSALGGSGKFNLFKVNSAADLMLSLEHLDEALKEAPVFVDTIAKFGLTPKPGLPSTQVAKLGVAIGDAQFQLDELAERMIQEPNNVVATLGFEKMRAIHQTLVDALTVDDVSLSAPKLDQFNFMATDDIQMAGNFGKQIMDNFVMYSKIGPDTRVSTLMAQMYSTLPTPQAKAKFLARANQLDTTNPPMMAKESIKMRQQLSKMIEDACGRH